MTAQIGLYLLITILLHFFFFLHFLNSFGLSGHFDESFCEEGEHGRIGPEDVLDAATVEWKLSKDDDLLRHL